LKACEEQTQDPRDHGLASRQRRQPVTCIIEICLITPHRGPELLERVCPNTVQVVDRCNSKERLYSHEKVPGVETIIPVSTLPGLNYNKRHNPG
jgi:hypothetical protein